MTAGNLGPTLRAEPREANGAWGGVDGVLTERR